MNVQGIRRELRREETTEVEPRRASIALSLVGMASMGATALLQTGLVRHLPDPPLPTFNSDKVNLSDDAFPFGVPDGPIALAGFAMNVPLAALGGANRARDLPWVPLLAFAKSSVDVAISGWLFYKMPSKDKAWCIYCIAAFFTNLGLLGLAFPEAKQAWAILRR